MLNHISVVLKELGEYNIAVATVFQFLSTGMKVVANLAVTSQTCQKVTDQCV